VLFRSQQQTTMLCEINSLGDNFLLTWLALTALGLLSIMVYSGTLFYFYYWPSNVTYDKWLQKTNPNFPSAFKVRGEIIQMLKGMTVGVFCPALSLWLTAQGKSQAYCGLPGEHGWAYFVASFFAMWIASDFWEFFYHRLGHVYHVFWTQHKHHHVFYNPTPFAVIADEYIDQFMRSSPMLVFPMLMPTNVDLMFFTFAVFFYGYGVYLHWGYEFESIDAHHPILNTSFQHFCHHSKAILHKPYHCGFFFKIWDQLAPGGVYPRDKCFCVKCSRAKGERTLEHFRKVLIPDYSVLLSVKFWLSTEPVTESVVTKEELYFQNGKSKAS